MLTKGDLSAIQSIVVNEVKSIVVQEVKSIVKEELNGIKEEIGELKEEMNKKIDSSTDQLIELITVGFNTQYSDFVNHERRITLLEQAAFPSN